jgi:lipid-A-disaccharide synthase
MSRPGPRILFLAGEASGDHHAAALIREIKRRAPKALCFGLGGPAMAAAGMRLDYGLASHSVIGFVEVLKHLPALRRAEALALGLLERERPDLVLSVDYPGFNLRFAEKAHARGFKTCHYISPQVWAWKAGRPRKMAGYLDKVLVTFPFEKALYDQVGLPAAFVGNPLMDSVRPKALPAAVRKRRGWGRGPLVGLLPGSRPQEVAALLPPMLATARLMAKDRLGLRFLLFKAPNLGLEHFSRHLQGLQGLDVELVEAGAGEDPYALRRCCQLALVASGTATLETAILGVPMLILYRINPLTYQIGKRLINLPYIGLANVVAGRKVAPEFIQGGLQPLAMAREALALLDGPEPQRKALAAAVRTLGGPGAARRAAQEALALAAS